MPNSVWKSPATHFLRTRLVFREMKKVHAGFLSSLDNEAELLFFDSNIEQVWENVPLIFSYFACIRVIGRRNENRNNLVERKTGLNWR